MSRVELMNNLKLATAELATARQKLANAQFQARHGMPNAVGFCELVEHTAYHKWRRLSAAMLAHE